jgi:hypothetical protein
MNRNDRAKIRHLVEQKAREHGLPLPDTEYGYSTLCLQQWMKPVEFEAFLTWLPDGVFIVDHKIKGKVFLAFDLFNFLDERKNSAIRD